MRTISLLLAMLFLSACAKEPVYNGVPAQTWSQLSSEQQRLISEQSSS